MEIVKVETIPLTMLYPSPHLQAHGLRYGADSVLVKIHSDEGIVGIGDTGAICRQYTGINQDGVMSIINDNFAPKCLIGEDPFEIEKILAIMDYEAYGFGIAKGVIDNALYDLVGKALNVPVHKLLGGPVSEKLPMKRGGANCTLLAESTEERQKRIVEECVRSVERGAEQLWIKVGLPKIPITYPNYTPKTEEEEIEMIKLIRDAVGDKPKIAVDSNAQWNPRIAKRMIAKMDRYDLWLVEQPVHRLDISGMAEVRRQVRGRVLIGADESSESIYIIKEMLRLDAVDFVRCKINKCGGILKATKIFDLCESQNVFVACTSTIGNDVNEAAPLQLAASNNWVLKSGMGAGNGHGICMDFLSKELPKVEKNHVIVPKGPGLSFELDDEKVGKYITPGKKPMVCEKKYEYPLYHKKRIGHRTIYASTTG